MGKLFHFNILNTSCIKLSKHGNKNSLQVIKMDGKVIEFMSPILVKELLMDFEGFEVKSSRESTNHHPLDFKLKLGKTYYLFPSSKSPDQAINIPTPIKKGESNDELNAAVKRIKIVITKKQLQEMLSNKSLLENIIVSGINKACLANSAKKWRPNLALIPEERELINNV